MSAASMTQSAIDHAEASSKFIEAKDHLEFHDQRLWDLRKKRDRESEQLPEWEELRVARFGDQGAHADPPRPTIWRSSSATRSRNGAQRALGAGTPPSTTRSCSTS